MAVGHCQICCGAMVMFENRYLQCLMNENHVGKFFYPYHPDEGGKMPPMKMVDLAEFSAEVEEGYKKPMTATKWDDAEDSVVGAVQSWNQQVMGKAWDDIVATYKDKEGVMVKFAHKPAKEPLVKFTSDYHMGASVDHIQPIKKPVRSPGVKVEYPCVFQSKPNGVMYKLKIPKSFPPAIEQPRSAFGKMVMKKIMDLKKVP